MRQVIDIREGGNVAEGTAQAVEVLRSGQPVVLPCEAGYHLSASIGSPESTAVVNALAAESGRAAVLQGYERQQLLPDSRILPPVADRLSRRCWPGPVVLDLPVEAFSEATWSHKLLSTIDGLDSIHIRVPAMDVLPTISAELQEPLWTLPLPREALDDTGRLDQFNVALVLDAGAPRFDSGASVVRVRGDEWNISEDGVVGHSTITRLASRVVIFVCTGNTCRSPMAEALFRKLLTERLQCSDEELVERGFLVASAGVAAMGGVPISSEAAESLRLQGIEFSSHVSQPLTDELAVLADDMFTMTRGHRDSILQFCPEVADRVHLLAGDDADISDPIGGSQDIYADCCRTIATCLADRLDQIIS